MKCSFCPLFNLNAIILVGILFVSRWQQSSSRILVRIPLTKAARLLPIELCEIAVHTAYLGMIY